MRRLITLLIIGLVLVTAQAAHAMFVRLPGSWIADVRLCADGFMISVGGTLSGGTTTVITVLDASFPFEPGIALAASGPAVVYETRVFRWSEVQAVGAAVEITLDRSENGRSLTDGLGRIGSDVIANCVLFEENESLLVDPLVISYDENSVECGTYQVMTGDSLGQIARRHSISTRALAEANSISNVNVIYAGTTLAIPCTIP